MRSIWSCWERSVSRKVDRLRDGTGKEWLSGGHHADVALGGDESLPFLAALVGAVENGQVLRLEMRCTLDGHGAADVLVSFLDLVAGEAEVAEHVEGPVVQFVFGDAEGLLAEFVA